MKREEFTQNEKGKPAKCKVCKKIFLPQHSAHKYCTHECSGRSTGSFKRLRFRILNRDNFKCTYCGRNPVDHNVILHVDHIIPVSKGGSDKETNLRTACDDCNKGKTDTLLNYSKNYETATKR